MANEFQWSAKYSFGLPDIDTQHEQLFTVIGRLIDSWHLEEGREIAASIALDFLINYVREHFAEEEELFKQTKYPKAKEHIKMHEDLRKAVADFKTKVEQGDYSGMDKFIEVAKNWLTNHILKVDREYVEFCKAAGIGLRPKYQIA